MIGLLLLLAAQETTERPNVAACYRANGVKPDEGASEAAWHAAWREVLDNCGSERGLLFGWYVEREKRRNLNLSEARAANIAEGLLEGDDRASYLRFRTRFSQAITVTPTYSEERIK